MSFDSFSSHRLALVGLAALGGLAGFAPLSAQDVAVVEFGAPASFLGDVDFASPEGTQTATVSGIRSSGEGGLFLYGSLTDSVLGTAQWVRPAGGSAAWRIGLSGAEFTGSDGTQTSTTAGVTGGHYLHGTSTRAAGGTAVWVADVLTGATTRIGLWDVSGSGLYTSESGAQTSTVDYTTTSGYLFGASTLYNGGAESAGQAAWLATASGGTTTRIGLYGTEEFTSSSGYQYAEVAGWGLLTESGWAAGASYRYNGGDTQLGKAAWVSNGESTLRVGLISGDASAGASYTADNGTQYSYVNAINSDAGYAIGNSYRYSGDTQVGYAAWASSLTDGSSTRLGFWNGEDSGGLAGNEFTGGSGIQQSNASQIALVGETAYAGGTSSRYNGGSTQLGSAAWITDLESGETFRMGLTEGVEFTKSLGTGIGTQSSGVRGITSSGYVYGQAVTYGTSGDSSGAALWVSSIADLTTSTRVGLYDAAGLDIDNDETEYTDGSGVQMAYHTINLTESGWLAGFSFRYGWSDAGLVGAGSAAWVASAATGETVRVGFTGEGYTNNKPGAVEIQFSRIYDTLDGASTLLNDKALVTGYSTRYKDMSSSTSQGTSSIQFGQAVWIADATKAEGENTTRIGLWEGVYTQQASGAAASQAAGRQTSSITGIHSGTDYVWGYSQRYTETATSDVSSNRTAWIYNVLTGDQVAFEFGASEVSGLSFSIVNGMTDSGIAYGYYTVYLANSDTVDGNRAFLWSESLGAQTLDSVVGAELLASGGWAYLSNITSAQDNGSGLLTLVGIGQLLAGGTATFSLTLDLASVPEPAAWAAILGGLALVGVMIRCRLKS